MFSGLKKKKLPLKTVYYLSFLIFIVIPIFIVLVGALFILNRQFKGQAMENIRQAQETIITEIKSDIDIMSMRLSHLIYTNDNEILAYAAETDTADYNRRYEYEQELQQAGNLALEPVKNIISVEFYMKDGRRTYIKNEINRTVDEIREMEWYKRALEKKNAVCLGSYDTTSLNDLYAGGTRDLLILIYALAPDVTTDRSQKIEMVVFYQSTDAVERIKEYNRGYLNGENKIGITRITDEAGNLVYSETEEGINLSERKYTCIRTPLELNDTVWYLESFIKTSDLTQEYWDSAGKVLLAAMVILLLAGYFSTYLLRSIVKPIEEISAGLKQIEEGNLEVHISAKGQSEIRGMIHQFNAMVRRLKALIGEYEEKMKSVELKPADYLAALMKQKMTPEEVHKESKEFFAEQYTLLGFYIENYGQAEKDAGLAAKIESCFERNPRYTSRCITYVENDPLIFSFYRITEKEYQDRLFSMVQELQKTAEKELGVKLFVCVGKETYGPDRFTEQVEEVKNNMCLRHLYGENAIVDLSKTAEKEENLIILSKEYEKLAAALYIVDEKNVAEEKEKLFAVFGSQSIEESREQVLAVILAIGNKFSADDSGFTGIFGQKYNYMDKLERFEDGRSLKLWVTNFLAWIMDYSASRLNVSETDVIVKAKRYIADHYEDADLSLSKVAEYVELNEKYFTNRFTKETGETFSSYLTALRMQKAKELLKTTSFKVYEISEMVGYNSVEHFNRVFKKMNDITPAGYRKTM